MRIDMQGVEFLVNELKDYDSAGLKNQSNYVIEMPTYILTELEEQAKDLEKERAIDFAKHCLDQAKDLDIRTAFLNVEEYYENFKSK
jgi:20S proteasome alpha/beta subunit